MESQFPVWADNALSKELPVLRARGEGQELEFMESFPENARELGKEIAAFATSNDGLILLGVSNSGDLVGLNGLETPEDRDSLIRRVEGLCHGPIRPSITPSLRFAIEDGRIVVALSIPKGSEPVYYCQQVPYLRHLTQSRPADPHEVVKLVRSAVSEEASVESESELQKEHLSEVAMNIRDLQIYGAESRDRNVAPGLNTLMAIFASVSESLRAQATSDEAEIIGWQKELMQIADFADQVGNYVHVSGRESWERYQNLISETVEHAEEVRRKFIDIHEYSPRSKSRLSSRLRELTRQVRSLAERAQSMLEQGRFDELRSEASNLGLSISRLGYLGFDRDEITAQMIKEIGHRLHLIDARTYSLGSGTAKVVSAINESAEELEEVTADL